MKNKLLLVVLCLFSGLANAQNSNYLKIDLSELEKALYSADYGRELTVEIPLDNSQTERFVIHQIRNNLPDELNTKYPGIKSFTGKSLDSSNTIVISYGYNRFFGTISKADGIVQFYNQKIDGVDTFVFAGDFGIDGSCGSCSESRCENENILATAKSTIQQNTAQSFGANKMQSTTAVTNSRGSTSTTFDIVVTTTVYQNELLGITTKAEGITHVNGLLDYVNAVYRRELAIEYVLHPNNDQVIYLDASDPAYPAYPDAFVHDSLPYLYIHNDVVKSLFDLSTFDSAILIIPSTVGRGGGAPCGNNRGYAASCNCNELLLHEIGHHLSGFHTYTYDKSDDIARIQNSMVGNNSPYMHAANFDNVQNVIDASTCGTTVSTGNTPPVVTESISGLTIPIGTPYKLVGAATDVDATASLTYTWQNMDVGSTEATKLQFAHATPSATENVKYVPSVSSLLTNLSDANSLLPTVSRTITSRLLVRDNQLPFGAVSYREATINVDDTAGPFLITSQDEFAYHTGGDDITITWDVANTTNATVNTQNVNVLLSIDNAVTWTTLLANAPNNGTATVTLPNTPSATCRVKVEAVGNLFYDINNADFEIVDANSPQIGYIFVETRKEFVDDTTLDFAFEFYKLGGYASDTEVSITGLPAGATSNLTYTITDEGNYNVSLGNLNNVVPGRYPLTVALSEVGGTLTESIDLLLVKYELGVKEPSKAIHTSRTGATWTGKFLKFDNSGGLENTNTFTITAWVKPENFDDDFAGIISFNAQTALNIRNTGKLAYHYEGTNNWSYVSTSALVLNEWNHVALVISPSGATMYVNGVPNVMNTVAHSPVSLNKTTTFLGAHRGSDRTVDGWIDEVKVYSKSLTEEEVRASMHTTVNTVEPYLANYFQFNDGKEYLDSRTQITALNYNNANVPTFETSTVPIDGDANFESSEQTTAIILPSTGVALTYDTADSGNTIAVNKLNRSPNSISGTDLTSIVVDENTYYEIYRFNQTTLGAATLVFTPATNVNATQAANPSVFQLYHRSAGNDGDWSLLATASSASMANNTITFSTIDAVGQFLLMKNDSSCSISYTWDGTTWSPSAPVADQKAVISGDYTGAGFDACSLEVTSGTVVFNSGELNIDGAITVVSGASVTVENGISLVQNQDVANVGEITVKRNSTAMVHLDYTMWGSPVSGQNLLDFSPNTLANRFYVYNNTGTSTTTAWVSVAPSTTDFAAGKGYLIMVDDNWTTTSAVYNGSFTGVPHNGDYSVAVNFDAGTSGHNSLSNPYPLPISSTQLFSDNSNLSTLYFWTHAVSGNASGVYPENNWASYTSTGGVAAAAGGSAPEDYIQTGQGFIASVTDATPIEFNNAQRLSTSEITNPGQFFRTTTTVERHRIWLNLTDASNSYNQILVGYMTGATLGVDTAIDGKLVSTSQTNLYSIIDNSADKFVIQGRPVAFDVTDEVPLGLTVATAGSYTISIDHVDGLFDTQAIYLWDKTLNVYHDLKASDYSFTTPSGTITDRFSVVYTNSLLSTPTVENVSALVYVANNAINITTGNEMMTQVNVYDIQGRLLVTKSNVNASTLVIENLTATNQVLLVEISTESSKTTKKVKF